MLTNLEMDLISLMLKSLSYSLLWQTKFDMYFESTEHFKKLIADHQDILSYNEETISLQSDYSRIISSY